ncbi:MAG: sulfatase-like hydrolase/transferase [Opitutaceae bacterium]|nr:sulfatase-like hydrolase/transferase [Opitutaceae bacterium]
MKIPMRFALLFAAVVGLVRAANPPPPNVVVIVSDDHRADALGHLGHPDLKTPHLDALARRSVVFRHAYVSGADRSSVCTPARTQLHSGRGLFRWSQQRPAETDPAGYALGRAFRAAGYATLRTGKGVNVPSPLNAEFERNIEGSSIPLETHLANALPFIREHAGRRPFLLVVEPRVPHSPYPSADRFRALYAPDKIALPAEFRSQHPFLRAEADEAAEAQKKKGRAPKESAGPWTEARARDALAQYYASISFLDDGVGQIVAALAETKVDANTIVAFLGDNGYSLGHHGRFAKSDVYENGGLHIPLLITGPGIAPRESRAFVHMIDVFPTLCRLAGFAPPARVDGLSLAPILRGEREHVRDVAFTHFRDEQFALRDQRWKLIRYPSHGRVEFFDLQSDPRELRDLSADPAHAARIADFTARIEREKAAVGYVWPIPASP